VTSRSLYRSHWVTVPPDADVTGRPFADSSLGGDDDPVADWKRIGHRAAVERIESTQTLIHGGLHSEGLRTVDLCRLQDHAVGLRAVAALHDATHGINPRSTRPNGRRGVRQVLLIAPCRDGAALGAREARCTVCCGRVRLTLHRSHLIADRRRVRRSAASEEIAVRRLPLVASRRPTPLRVVVFPRRARRDAAHQGRAKKFLPEPHLARHQSEQRAPTQSSSSPTLPVRRGEPQASRQRLVRHRALPPGVGGARSTNIDGPSR
jgi:hypothetical protein